MLRHPVTRYGLLLLLLGLPLLAAGTVATRQPVSPLPGIFSAGRRVRDDVGRTYEILKVDGDWAQVRLFANGLPTQGESWLHIPTAHGWTGE